MSNQTPRPSQTDHNPWGQARAITQAVAWQSLDGTRITVNGQLPSYMKDAAREPLDVPAKRHELLRVAAHWSGCCGQYVIAADGESQKDVWGLQCMCACRSNRGAKR